MALNTGRKRRIYRITVAKTMTNGAYNWSTVNTTTHSLDDTESGSHWLPPLKGFKRGVGRNNQGRITRRHRGGGHKRLYRPLTWLPPIQKNFEGEKPRMAICSFVRYDPNRSAWIACMLPCDASGAYVPKRQVYWTLAPEGLKQGDFLSYDEQTHTEVLNGKSILRQRLGDMPFGANVHAICRKPGSIKKANLVLAAGTSAKLVSKQGNTVIVEMPSGRRKQLRADCYATYSVVSNKEHMYTKKLRKAGENRWRGKRPTVRGVAMNPVDHPHGGGEGKTSGGRASVTPWGRLTKGKPTVKHKK